MHRFVMGDALKLNKRPVSPRHALLKNNCLYICGGRGRAEDKNPHRKPQQQARLPDARVPDEQQLEEVVTAR